ncbi:hypothetical protein NL676_032230 [Syzygium grande]|nr:hypothetical protein NL676_032230 [Syzygium grande]
MYDKMREDPCVNMRSSSIPFSEEELRDGTVGGGGCTGPGGRNLSSLEDEDSSRDSHPYPTSLVRILNQDNVFRVQELALPQCWLMGSLGCLLRGFD